MMPTEIESLVDEILESYQIHDLPIDPLHIAEMEGVALLPGRYDGCFDSRIEYRKGGRRGRFCLFYAEPEFGLRTEGRVRFSVGHELGHFYIPRHREYLLSGVWHGSRVGFVSEKPLEREADQFAASLLMPRRQFADCVRKRRNQCSLKDLAELATSVFETSVLSTVIRYVQLDYEPCCVIFSKAGQVIFSLGSESFRGMGLGWLPRGAKVASTSVTSRIGRQQADKAAEGHVEAGVWFDRGGARSLWEEALVLGHTGTVTFLACEENDDEDDEW